jgi:hypothetical protein
MPRYTLVFCSLTASSSKVLKGKTELRKGPAKLRATTARGHATEATGDEAILGDKMHGSILKGWGGPETTKPALWNGRGRQLNPDPA